MILGREVYLCGLQTGQSSGSPQRAGPLRNVHEMLQLAFHMLYLTYTYSKSKEFNILVYIYILLRIEEGF